MSEEQDLPESMQEDPHGGCRALLWLAIGTVVVVAGVLLKIFVWR